MNRADATFREAAAEPRLESERFSHVSVELGHIYMEDFAAGAERLRTMLSGVARWVEVASQTDAAKPRVSTSFMIDDYFSLYSTPAKVLPMLLDVAHDCGLSIDYLARESACAVFDGVPLAELVEARLIPVPPVGTNGSRPLATEIGWLSNGERTPADSEAMRRSAWKPPVEIGARNHSVFVDVELWSKVKDGKRKWSCAFLAAVWQLMRLGLIRDQGRAVVHPRPWDGDFPAAWDELPAITQLNPRAKPFAAYRTFSVLPSRFLQVELAVRTILSQVAMDPALLDHIINRATGEDMRIPAELIDRVGYVFLTE
ncbi:SCO2522 family protein [Kibdelosporangium philippinense]|uniref:SCO2522 family protein n=1 Tax=Kibdelosporangium philippinense TaxID=211113 RepID=A0ABS8ZTJ7_9PSEU|nr:SCO2522 family protein [Kibdelosporangium philippinense]MCE7011031.1 SCO2522 family protein [Kibdelosporangium philippinense]